MYLNQKIDFELAEILNNRIYSDIYDDKYAAGDVTCTYDNYLGSEQYKYGEYIETGDYVHGNYYYAPTYSEVIDWLFDKGIIIEFIPAFTFALKDNVAYYYSVYQINKDEGKLHKLLYENMEMSSFKLAMKTIIEFLIKEKYID